MQPCEHSLWRKKDAWVVGIKALKVEVVAAEFARLWRPSLLESLCIRILEPRK